MAHGVSDTCFLVTVALSKVGKVVTVLCRRGERDGVMQRVGKCLNPMTRFVNILCLQHSLKPRMLVRDLCTVGQPDEQNPG